MNNQYLIGIFVSAFLGFWGSQAVIYFYVGQLEYELNATKRRRNMRCAVRVSLGTAVVVSLLWFLQKYIRG